MTPAVMLLADDLTGAAGTAALFADAGSCCAVALDGGAISRLAGDPPDLLAIDLATRDRPDPEPERVRAAMAAAFAAGAALVAKRIDSTLRGHLRAEIAAALAAALPGTLALLCPAVPALDRTVRDGWLWLRGARAAHLREVAGNSPATGSLDLATVREGPEAVAAALHALAEQGMRLIPCDAEHDADIRAIAAGVATLPVLPCDPGPLTLALARVRGLLPDAPPSLPVLAAVRAPVLAVLGSRTPLTRRQVAHAEQAGLLALVPIRDRPAVDGRALERALARDRPAIGLLPAFGPCDEHEAARTLGRAAAAALRQTGAGGLYLTGGHTARAVLAALGADELRVAGSLLPLAARSVIATGQHTGLTVVTKGGMVGDDTVLAQCIHALTRTG